jgi:ABC-type transport system involved in multi-copper enzyme maturation permease subunit
MIQLMQSTEQKMIWIIARKEFLTSLLTYRFGIGLILCIASAAAGTLAVIQDYSYRQGAFQKAIEEYKDEIEQEVPYCWTVDDIKTFRKPRRLAIFSVGTDRWQGNVVETSFHKVPVQAQWLGSSNPFLAVFRSIDLSLIVQIILGLLAVLFAYDVVSGEKEEGTLKLMLANQVPRDQILLGKALGDLGVLSAILLAGFLVGLSIVQLSPAVQLNQEEIGRIGGIFVISLLYLTAVYFIGLLVSTCTQRASTSLVVSMFIWLSAVAIFPPAVAYAVDQLTPMGASVKTAEEKTRQLKKLFEKESEVLCQTHTGTKSYREFFTYGSSGGSPHWLDYNGLSGKFRLGPEKSSIVRALKRWDVPFSEEEPLESLIPRFKASAQEKGADIDLFLGYDPPVEIERKVGLIRTFLKHQQPLRVDYADRIWNEGWAAVEQRLKKAADLVRFVTLISPAGAYLDATAILARTDRGDYWHFLEASRQYRRQLISSFDQEGIWSAREWFNMQEKKTKLSLPRFREFRETIWQAVGRAGPNLMVLAGFNLIGFLGAYWRFRRYDVR